MKNNMQYIIMPTEVLKEFDPDWEIRRKSVDGTNSIIHLEKYNELIPPVMTLDLDNENDEISYPFPVVEGKELENLLESNEWNTSII